MQVATVYSRGYTRARLSERSLHVQSQLKLRKNPRTVSPFLSVLTFVVGILLGAGGVWLWQWRAVKQARAVLETTTYHLKIAQYELNRLQKITDLRKEIDANVTKILDGNRRSDEVNNGENGKNKKSMEVQRIGKNNISSLSGNVAQLEETLAKLENREPRKFDFLPKVPNQLQILRVPR